MPLFQLSDCPISRNGNGRSSDKQRRQQLIFVKKGKPNVTGSIVGIAERFDAGVDPEDFSAPGYPVLRQRIEGKLHTIAALGLGESPIGAVGLLLSRGSHCEGVGLCLKAARRNGDILRCRLSGEGIGRGRHQPVDPGIGGELIVPVHRHEEAAACLPVCDERAQDHRAERAFHLHQIGTLNPCFRRITRMKLDERFGQM